MHLSTEEHGAYFLLMMHYWSNGEPLPDDDGELAVITKISPHKWKKFSQKVRKFFIEKDGMLFHKRLEDELKKAAEISQKRAEAGKQKHNKTPSKTVANDPPIAQQLQTQPQSQSHKKEVPPIEAPPKSTRKKPETPLPDNWTLPPDWKSWAEETYPHLDADKEGRMFHNHAMSKERKARDWKRAWMNWIEKAETFHIPKGFKREERTEHGDRAAIVAAFEKSGQLGAVDDGPGPEGGTTQGIGSGEGQSAA